MSTLWSQGIILGILITATSSVYVIVYSPAGILRVISGAGVLVGMATLLISMPSGSPI